MTKTKFGVAGLMLKTPLWAKVTFRIVAALSLVAAFIVAGDPGINSDLKVRIMLYLAGFDKLILMLSKLFGVEPEEEEEEEDENETGEK